MKKVNWKVLIFSLIIVYFIGFVGSLFTSIDNGWYESIRPSITPPSFVFPIMWNILFFLIALSLYFAWINSNKKDKKKIIFVFGINLILNALWSLFYFKLQNPLVAFFDLILIWISIIAMFIVTYKIKRTSAYLLIPYLLWVSFAGVLNWLSIK